MVRKVCSKRKYVCSVHLILIVSIILCITLMVSCTFQAKNTTDKNTGTGNKNLLEAESTKNSAVQPKGSNNHQQDSPKTTSTDYTSNSYNDSGAYVQRTAGATSDVGVTLNKLSESISIEFSEAPKYIQFVQQNNEQYDNINDNDFLSSVSNPLSTFSIDVDTASYSNIRRFINSNQMPPKDAVRIEEMINYFTYDYPQPKDGTPFSTIIETSRCPWNPKHNLVLVGLQGQNMAMEDIPPSNLVFLLDVSGSMNSPDKLPLLKSAFKLLTDQLRSQDKVSIVVYAGASGLVLKPTSGGDKQEILSALERLEAGGSTAGAAGIELAYEIAAENIIESGNNRVILATDGDFNVGISSDEKLVKLIEEKRNQGIFLTILGFGTGNYKDSKMEKLADKGNGNYAYIDNLSEARKVLVDEMSGTLLTIAKDVKIQVEFNPAKIRSYRLIGYENRLLAKEDFNDDTKDAGELGVGHTVTALYEVIPQNLEDQPPIIDDLKYQTTTVNYSDELLTVKLRYKEPDENESKLLTRVLKESEYQEKISGNLGFAAAVAEFGMLLRDSEFKGDSNWQQVLVLAQANIGADLAGYREEFISLVEKAIRLSDR